MAKYLIRASYTAEGAKGLLRGGGGTARRAAVEETMRGVEGKVESFYYAFGEDDAYVIVDAPDNVVAAAVAMTVNASGAAVVKTTVLMTPEEIDKAAKTRVTYRPPGQ